MGCGRSRRARGSPVGLEEWQRSHVPLDDEAWMLFEGLWAARQYQTVDGSALSAFVFHRGDGQAVSEFYFCELWDKARKATGLPSKLFHDYPENGSSQPDPRWSPANGRDGEFRSQDGLDVLALQHHVLG
jgi:hypothetical protein